MKAMETIQDLIEEAKLRTVWWALCIFVVSYFLSSKLSSLGKALLQTLEFSYSFMILSVIEFNN